MNLFDIYKKILCKILDEFPDKIGKCRVDSELFESDDDCGLKKYLPQCIYHYTTKDVLWNIIMEGSDLYCTYFEELSDPTEFKTGMFAETRIWRKVCNGDTERFVRPLAYFDELSGSEGIYLCPWIMSFSLARDKTSQWKEYTDCKNGGYAIGFNPINIVKKIEGHNLMTNDAWSWTLLLPCMYVGYDDSVKIERVIRYLLNDVSSELKEFLDKGGHKENNEHIARALVYALSASLIKHADFREEKEWRLIVQPFGLHKAKDIIKLFGGKLRIKSGLFEYDMLYNAIEEIVVSPHGPNDTLLDVAKIITTAKSGAEADNKINVVVSESPYRGE